jgi:uncharacterized lipoprotein NlpE involved in copper resistance
MLRKMLPRTLVPMALAASLLALGGCSAPSDGATARNPDPAHNSRNAVDWAGTYQGVLPCADCPGIRTRLVLQPDGRFELSTQYIDRQAAPQVRTGHIQWNEAGNTITLPASGERAPQFRVGEGRLLQLYADGSAPPWSDVRQVLTKLP